MKNHMALIFISCVAFCSSVRSQSMITNIMGNGNYTITHTFTVGDAAYFVDVSLSGKLSVNSFDLDLELMESYEIQVSNFKHENRIAFYKKLAIITYVHKVLIIDIYSKEIKELDLPKGYSSEFSTIELIDEDNFILYLKDLELNIDVAFIVLTDGTLKSSKLPKYKVLHKYKNYFHLYSADKGHSIYNLVGDKVETIDKYGLSNNPWIMEENGFWYFDSSGFFNFRKYGSKDNTIFFDILQMEITNLTHSSDKVIAISFEKDLVIKTIDKLTKEVSEHSYANIREGIVFQNSIVTVGSRLIFQCDNDKTYAIDLTNWSLQSYDYDSKIIHKNYVIGDKLQLVYNNNIHQFDLVSATNSTLMEMPNNVGSEIEFNLRDEYLLCYYKSNIKNEKVWLSFFQNTLIKTQHFLKEFQKGIAEDCELFSNDEALILRDINDLYKVNKDETKQLNDQPLLKLTNDFYQTSHEKISWWEKSGLKDVLKIYDKDNVISLIDLHELIGLKGYNIFREMVLIATDIGLIFKIENQEIKNDVDIVGIKVNGYDKQHFMQFEDKVIYFSNHGIHQVVDISTTELIPIDLPSNVSFTDINNTLYFTERHLFKLIENNPIKIDLDIHFYQKVSIIDRGDNYLFLCIEILKKDQYFLFFEPNNLVQLEELSDEIEYEIHNDILYSVIDYNKLLVYDIKRGVKNIYDLGGDFLKVVEVESINHELTGVIISSTDHVSYHVFTVDQEQEEISELAEFNHAGNYNIKRLVNVPILSKTFFLGNDEVFEIDNHLLLSNIFEDKNIICRDGVVVKQDIIYYFGVDDEKGKQVYELNLDDLSHSNHTVENAALAFKVFPNPSSSYLTFENKTGEIVDFIKIVDTKGNCIEHDSNWVSNTIEIAHLPDGYYYIQFYSGKGVESHAFIKIAN